jgi:hypothetical protein
MEKLKPPKKVCMVCGNTKYAWRRGNHHVIPVKHGGKHLKNNRVWLCTRCHSLLHTAEQKGLCELPKLEE